ncbi:MAG TPA: hypothetical protein VE377_03170 [Candidatus Dormibacteraeota bacterium]|nr:hypothetical protein [Candidatus Dormibacteraeota bacterium]
MKRRETIRAVVISPLVLVGLSLLVGVPVWAQTDTPPSQPPVPAMVGLDHSSVPAENYNPDASDDRMLTPPPVSGQAYPIALSSEERSNYLRGGVSFTGAYSDNVLGTVVNGHQVSDQSYSVAPMIALDETTSRLHYLVTYAPGFTFYQHTSSRNAADHNAAIEFEYRLSPHVTLSARDAFQKTSNVFNQPPNFGSGGVVSGGAQGPNFSVIAPIANQLSNFGNVGISYQFALNDMVGGSGTFSNLHYLNPEQVSGLYDSSSQGGLAFYSHRIAKAQYVGATYVYQRLLSYPTLGMNETQTQAALLFYTLAPTRKFSISLFGGPQYSNTVQPVPLLPVRSWSPAGGASLGWQGRLNTFALSYTHLIAGGGGLIGAAKVDSVTVSARQQVTRTLSASIAGGYAQNDIVGSPVLGAYSGHSINGTASLEQQIGQHLGVQLGYTRIHQNYSNVAVLSATPDTNRGFVSISYQFSRALGR